MAAVSGRQLQQELGFRRGFRAQMSFVRLALESHDDHRVRGVVDSLVWALRSGRLSFHVEQCLCQLSPAQFVEMVARVASQGGSQADQVRGLRAFFDGHEHDGQLRYARDYLGL